jgi:acetyltransferase-like isoleucine patch superfamily enzyme/dTDP-4-dehydrorhamnose 3,5-epimerase-like enzyme
MDHYLHPQGICESASIGSGTKIWAFAHVLAGARLGKDCNICDHVFIENDVIMGDRVTVKCGVQLWDGMRIADDVFIGPNATFTNDPFPRSKQRPEQFAVTRVGAGASIGANATILPGVAIGERAMVGAGAVVTRSVPPFAIVVGNPARIVGYADAHSSSADVPATGSAAAGPAVRPTRVKGVTLHRLARHGDLRGELMVAEFQRQVPFTANRFFLVFSVPSSHIRGEHAHRLCHQFILCAHGQVTLMADDGRNREEFLLDRPETAVHLPPLTWGVQFKYSADAVLLVFASHVYDPDDYIRDYAEFRKIVQST